MAQRRQGQKRDLIMIDGSSFLYRAFYALRPLHTAQGVPVQAVYGFVRMFKKLIDTFSPSLLLVAWDSGGRTVRHELSSAYKAQRQAPPSDLFVQKELIQQFLELLQVCQVAQPACEADDLLYTLAQKLRSEVDRIFIVTTDKDLAQLVDDALFLYDAFKEQVIDRAAVEKQFGVPPEKLLLYLSLLGDASDNIPGVAGIGSKTAQPLAVRYGSVAQLYDHIDEVVPERLRKKLLDQKELAVLSEQLIQLRMIPLDTTLAHCAFDIERWQNARDFFVSLGFHSLLKGMEQSKKESFAQRYGVKLEIITSHEALIRLCKAIKTAGACALDIETTNLDPLRAELVGIAVCYEKGSMFYIPVSHSSGERLSEEIIKQELQPLLSDTSVSFYFHNAVYDMAILQQYATPVHACADDTMLMASLCVYPGERKGLKQLSQSILHQEMETYSELLKSGPYDSIRMVPLLQAADYAAADAHQTLQLQPLLQQRLRETKQEWLYRQIELPLIPVLLSMEQEGIILDIVELAAVGAVLERQSQAVKDALGDLIGPAAQEINFNSHKQIEKLLFDTLGLEPVKKKASGGYSTDQEVLTELAAQHPVPKLLVTYRELAKIKSTYVDALIDFVHPVTGRIHTSLSQISTATGRLASSDPNMQNIPVDRYEGISIRSAFKAPKGHLFISADYSQIELRVLAYVSQDAALMKSFAQDEDVHRATAARIFNVPLAQVTHEQRQVGKRINFSILYGVTPYGLSRDLRIPFGDAKQYIDSYFAQYPGVARWMEYTIRETERTGYTATWAGRKRMVSGIHEQNRHLQEAAQRIAVNTVAQGTAAEVMKLGMLSLFQSQRLQNMDMKLILQIHDELLITVPEQYVSEAAEIIRSSLEHVVAWNIPLRVTIRQGITWGEVSK